MIYWMNEREVPFELLELSHKSAVPNELRTEIIRAKDEVDNYGAVNYPTKAKVEYYLHKYQDLLDTLLGNEE